MRDQQEKLCPGDAWPHHQTPSVVAPLLLATKQMIGGGWVKVRGETERRCCSGVVGIDALQFAPNAPTVQAHLPRTMYSISRFFVRGVVVKFCGGAALLFMRLKSSQTEFLSDPICAPCTLWPST